VTEALRLLAATSFELALLARLTVVGLKPLSRYEAALPEPGVEALARLGLDSAAVRRRLLGGGERQEHVFSRSAELIELYREAFADTPVAIDRAGGLLEGQLFGFPPCCVLSYVDEGYRDNGLPAAEQAELFHWACPGCELTPRLLSRVVAHRRQLEELLAHESK
jgi:hypothetical protein